MQQAVHWWLSTYERLVKSQKFFSSYLTQEDLSRIGRNYLQTGFYTEVMFRQNGVHFVAVANNIDSEEQDSGEFAPFLNIMNEWYLRDQSKKVSAAYRVKGKAGKPTTNNAIYGYKKDRSDKDHWLVDEEAAAVVRRIFRLAVEGHGPYEISKILTQEKVECPAYYLARNGRGSRKNTVDTSRPYDWYGFTVSSMLAKPEYMGHTVNFRSSKKSYRDKRVKNDPSDWLIFENTHEAIGLEQIVVFQVLVYIENGQLLAVEAGQEHIYNQKDVKGLCFLALHTVGNIFMVCSKCICREVCAVLLVIVLDDPFQGIPTMFIFTLSLFILPIREDTANIQVMFDLLEDVVVFNQSFNRRDSKDGCVLTISRLCLVILNDMVCDQRHPFLGHVEFAYINRIRHCGIVPVKITFHCFNVLDMEAENIVVEYSVLDEIIMYAFSEQHFRCLRNFPLSLSVHLKTGCAGKTKKLRLLEVPNDVLMHIPKLTTVTLINNEDNLFIFVGVHDL